MELSDEKFGELLAEVYWLKQFEKEHIIEATKIGVLQALEIAFKKQD
jgi:hypothetical protein